VLDAGFYSVLVFLFLASEGIQYKIQKQGEKGNEIGLAKQVTTSVLSRGCKRLPFRCTSELIYFNQMN
jgi:hypothetical protein